MVEPTGYTALDLIGFTDRGPYDPDANYVKNDLVHVGNSTWRCKIDDTTGITPTEGANWTIFIESATSLAGMSDVDLNTPKAGDGLVHDGNEWTNVPIMTKEQWKKNGAYNLYQMNMSSQVISGVIFTKISKGTFSLNTNGTLTSAVTIDINPAQLFPAGTYKFLGAPSGVTNLGFSYIYQKGDTWNIVADSDTFTTDGTETTGWVRVYLYSGCNLDGTEIFKPMITTDLNATYDDFVEFAKTNLELTEKIDAYAKYNLHDYSTNGCTVYATGVRIGNMAVLQGKWFKSAGLAGGTDYITSLPSDLIPSEDMTGSGILVRQSDGSIEPSLPKVTTTGVVYESSTGDVLTTGSFSIVYRVK